MALFLPGKGDKDAEEHQTCPDKDEVSPAYGGGGGGKDQVGRRGSHITEKIQKTGR